MASRAPGRRPPLDPVYTPFEDTSSKDCSSYPFGMRAYHAYTPDQAFLLPPSLSDDAEAALDAISPDDPVHIVRQVVHDFDLSAIHRAYQAERGRPPFHPEAMVGLLLYGACRGIYSSRKLAHACRDHIAFMYLTSQ